MALQKQDLQLKGGSEEDALPGFHYLALMCKWLGDNTTSPEIEQKSITPVRDSHIHSQTLQRHSQHQCWPEKDKQQEIRAATALQTQDSVRCLRRDQRSDKPNLTHTSLGFLPQTQLQMKPIGCSPITSAELNCFNCSRYNSQT